MGIIVGDSSTTFASGSGSTKLGDTKDDMHQMTGSFMLQADVSNAYAATIDNDQSSAGHGLKVTSDGNSTGTVLLDLESGTTSRLRVRADGSVGIGATTMGQKLTVEGDIGVASDIIHKGDSDTKISFTNDQIQFDAGGVEFIRLTESDGGQDTLYINHDQEDLDVLMSGDDLVRLFHVNAGNNRVGIGTSTGDTILHVTGTATIDQIVQSPTRVSMGSGTSTSLTPITGTLYFLDAHGVNQSGGYHEMTIGNGLYDGQKLDLIASSSIAQSIRLGAGTGNAASGAVTLTSSDSATLNGKTIIITDTSGNPVQFTYTTAMSVGNAAAQSAGYWMIGCNGVGSTTDAASSLAAGVTGATSAGDFSMSQSGGGSSATITLTQNIAGSNGNTSISGTAEGSVASFTDFSGGSDGTTNVHTVSDAGIRIRSASPTATLIWDSNSSEWQVVVGERL